MKRGLILIVVLAFIGLLAAGWWWARTSPEQAVDFLVVGGLEAGRAEEFVAMLAGDAEPAPEQALVASGSIEGTEVSIVSEVGGRITGLHAGEGDEVQAGQALVELDDSLLQAQMSLSLAYKVNKSHSIAASPVFSVQQFRAYGLGVFKPKTTDPDNLTGRGNDYAYGGGARLGYQGKLTDWLTIGAAYQSRIYFTKFDKYKGLFAEQGSLDSPEKFGAGFSIQPTKKLTIAFDWERTLYSNIKAIGLSIEQLSDPNCFLGADCGAGFGWQDQDVYKVGMKYQLTPKWDVMLGYNYGEVPMPDDQLLFSTLAPAVTEHHATIGAVYRQSKSMEWTLAYVHAFKNTEKGLANSGGQFDNFFPNENNDGPGPVELQMYQDSLEFTFSFKL